MRLDSQFYLWLLEEYAAQLHIPFLETSALDATNVEQAFVALSKDLMQSNRYIDSSRR
jgi:hypothetical protein